MQNPAKIEGKRAHSVHLHTRDEKELLFKYLKPFTVNLTRPTRAHICAHIRLKKYEFSKKKLANMFTLCAEKYIRFVIVSKNFIFRHEALLKTSNLFFAHIPLLHRFFVRIDGKLFRKIQYNFRNIFPMSKHPFRECFFANFNKTRRIADPWNNPESYTFRKLRESSPTYRKLSSSTKTQ